VNSTSQREELRWKLKPFPELVRLAWPITVSMLSFSIMTLIDTLFAGRLGATSVGAVGFGGVVTFTLLCFAIGLIQAAKVLVAQAVGAARRDKVAGHIGAALVVAGVLGGVTMLVGQVVALCLPRLADGSAAVRLARGYVSLRVLGAPVVLAGFAIREVRCALGDSRTPMRTALVANVLHVPMNYALIFTLGLGVRGAAISTVLAQCIETALLVLVQRREGLGLRAWTRKDLEDLFRTGWPLGLERLFNVGSFAALVTLLARVSDTDLAAHQIANQLSFFAILPMMSVAEASAVLAGQAVGAGEDHLVRRIARIATATGAAYGALCAVVYLTLGHFLAATLTHDVSVQELAARLLRVAAAWQAFVAAYLVAAAVLRGAGDVRFATLTMVVVAWVVTPPLAALLAIGLHMGALGGWLALLAEWAAGAVVLCTRVHRSGFRRAAEESRARLAEHRSPELVAEPARG
jgi:multidrug resistance protein, MATE family